MMQDFTLVIPTYNRAQSLAALLSYLETENADCRILVLDSSLPETLAANRIRVTSSSLDVEFAEFADLEPAEKWRQGIHKVTTPFCALCADDDIVILAGVRRCLDALRTNVSASTVQGYSFTFLPRSDGDMELNNIVYFRPTIDDASPLQRLDKLFQQYQALSYGVFRTPTLRRILDALQPLTKTLTRELLWSALTVINGAVIRLPHFSYGRSMRPSAAYDYWHPLEWFCKDPDSLFADYLRYRELTAAAIIQRPDNEHQLDEIHEMLDIIHLRYLVRNTADSAMAVIIAQQIVGADFAEYWPWEEIKLSLYETVGIRASAASETLSPVDIRGHERAYRIFPAFYAPQGIESPQMANIVRLINILDNYPPTIDRNIASS